MISIIIPAYNCGRTIEKCIDSILYQTYKDYEIIIVNDGSIDNTLERLKKYDGKINIFSQKNRGVSSARNFGMKQAKGKYLFFLDSDDYLECETLKILYNAAEEKCLDLIATEIVDEHMMSHEKNVFPFVSNFYADNNQDIGRYAYYMRLGSAVGKLFRKDIIIENNLHFFDELKLAEDSIFVHSYLNYCTAIEKIGNARYIVQNINESSLSKQYVENIEKSVVLETEALKSCFLKYPMYEEEYYKYMMDIDATGCFMLTKNFFLRGCILGWNEKIKKLNSYLFDENMIRYFDDISPKKKPKNRIDKIQCRIFRTKSTIVILVYFYLKENIKNFFFLKRKSRTIIEKG